MGVYSAKLEFIPAAPQWTFPATVEQAQSLGEEFILFLKNYALVYWTKTSWFQFSKDLLFAYVFTKILRLVLQYLKGYGLLAGIRAVYGYALRSVFNFVLSLPPIKRKVDAEISQTRAKIESALLVSDAGIPDFTELPAKGLPTDKVYELLDKLNDIKHSDWKHGRISGAVYHGGDELIELQSKAYHQFSVANQLHPDVFPAVRKMDSEVVSMTLHMFNAPETGCGTSTSGGTESLLLACLSAREYGKKYKGITSPEMVAPESIHAGVFKAASYFGIRLHLAPLDPVTFKVDLKAVKRLVNTNTVLILGSAPNFPHGVIDDIEGLSKISTRWGIPLHVDCCLGSFIVANLTKAGFKDVPLFDFRVPGVTSISCDTHKYGFAPKGSSVIMYRNNKLRECQYYISTEWMGGLYGSPTLAGSRPGALMAGCWATMVNIGQEGYVNYCREIVTAARRLKDAITNEIAELDVIGDPIGSVVAFKSNLVNVHQLGDKMGAKGWHLSALQKPPALHLAATNLSIPIVEELISDLKASVEELKESGSEKDKGDTAALYGVAGNVQTGNVADRIISAFIDTLYKV
ncbi:unnamed protein product [Kuraishia capsulata CBS 1993]|uniref:sphinganine-1-phosphate aldolase n=1 Tax=Kuraishia capsulata CBS 1993 TaxID=1382522 RepID=W6MJP5_9ASCO|nr:uncharacterized protein KUCA_T00000678001 [Kuraishia capsulata CBS 1993]CDK24712.1 unnamed protein product [Kuraishia capsulata CBS 1993]